MIEMKKISTLDGFEKFMVRSYGNEPTNLHLTVKAYAIFCNTDPIDIYERAIEDNDCNVVGYEYFCRGCIEADHLAEEEVNNMLEELAEEN
jgi:hypothetical protein